MAIASLVLTDLTQIYEDTTPSNNPQQVLLDYKVSINREYTSYRRYDLTRMGAFDETLILPASPCTFLYLLCDQILSVRFNGEVDNNCQVSPSVAGTKDGLFIKRGSFTGLEIFCNILSLTNVTIFVGA